MVSRKEILKAIREEAKDILNCDCTINEDTLLLDIGDSLELTELFWKLEEKYNVSIPLNANKIGDIINYCFPAAA